MTIDLISKVLSESKVEKSDLIPILQKTQEVLGFLAPYAIQQISDHLKISENEIYGVATFYAQFRFIPPGEHHIRVCVGTACHVKGGEQILDAIKRRYEIEPGETTDDGLFDLERVACLGCCALAPVIKIDDTIYGQVSVLKLQEILETYENDECN